MLSFVLPVGFAAALLSLACWGLGSRLVASREPLVAMLGGWCLFLVLCAGAWLAGVPADRLRPCFWIFFLAGLVAMFLDRRGREAGVGLVCTAIVTALLCAPFWLYPRVLAYGAHGTDMWGYVNAAEWLTGHSIRDLPVPGVESMRFNWIAHVLGTQERPLNFELLAGIASACGLTPTQAYFVCPIALLASLAMTLARTTGLFRLGHGSLAVATALALVFHPLIVLPWIAGFAGGAIVALFLGLAFAAAAAAEEGPARSESLMLVFLALVLCAPLYSIKFLAVAPVAVLLPLGQAWARHLREHGRPGLLPPQASGLTLVALAAALFFAVVSWHRVADPEVGGANPQSPSRAFAHFLGLFGGSSPYSWIGFRAFEPIDVDAGSNLPGCAALAAMTAALAAASWSRWRAHRDLRLPLLVGICLGCLWITRGDERTMAKAMPVFGLALLLLLAVASRDCRPRWLGLLAGVVCCLPAVRSRTELHQFLHAPYILATEDNLDAQVDATPWMNLAYLNFREDRRELDWAKFPRTFQELTHFLPREDRERIVAKYHLPARWADPEFAPAP
ncbi:MAG TPA: hypothetical protein VG838_07530 [Opitutaceae bacterium]|nr:hypothetical protein [Opitutaceae bacterium]